MNRKDDILYNITQHNFSVILPIRSIASGVQTEEHPQPGRSFFAVGFPRTTYIPDCPLGRKVCGSYSIFLILHTILITIFNDFFFGRCCAI